MVVLASNPPKGYTTRAGLAELIGIGDSGLKKILVGKETKYNKKFRDFLNPIIKSYREGPYRYYKIPTDRQLEKIKEFFGRTTISQDLINDIKALHNNKTIQSFLNKGELPPLEVATEVTGKSVGRTANAMGTLGMMYRGKTYRGFELPANAKKGKLIFNKIKTGRSMTNPYKRAFYQIAVDEVDKSIGQEVGTFRKFKRFFKENLNKYLGKGHGFSLNEITSISGSVGNKLAPYAAFVDLTKADINTGRLAGLQGDLSKALTRADKLIKAGNVDAGYEEIRKFNEITRPKFIEGIDKKFPGASKQLRIPEIITGTKLTDTYKASDLAKFKDMGIDLQSLADEKKYYLDVKGARPYPEIAKNLKRNLLNAANRLSKKDQLVVCSFLSNGGLPGDCANAIKKDPIKAAQIFENSPGTSAAMQKLKSAATSFLRNPGIRGFGAAAIAGAAGAGLVKQFNNNDPTTYLSNEDQQKSMLVDMATDSISTSFDRPAILDYQLPALGAEAAAGLAVTAPSTIKASKSRAFGIEKKRVAPGTIKTGARVLGRGLASLGTPLALLPMEAMNITSQIAEGDSPLDIATDPLNYLGATFAEPATKIAQRGINPRIASAMRLGMSPGALRVLSRFGGVGLGASLGIMGLQKLSDL